MRLIIVRHGETYWNTQKMTQGMSDTQLTQNGIRQAQLLGLRLSSTNVRCVFTSPLKRAMDTAIQIAHPCNCQVQAAEELKEMCFGDWEGLTFEQIGERFARELEIWNQSPNTCPIPNGESMSQIVMRVDSFVQRIKQQYMNNIVVAVTHSVPSKLLVARAIGLSIENIHSLRMDNASLTMIDYYQERPVLRLLNDSTHLQEGITWQK